MRFWDVDSDAGERHPSSPSWTGGVSSGLCVVLVLFIGLGAHSSKNALAPAAPLLEAEGMSALLYSMIAASPQLGAIVAPVLWGMAYTWSERLVQVLVPLGDFLGQLVLVAGLELWAANAAPHLTEMVLACGLVIFSIARAGVGVVQHAAMARLLLGQSIAMVGCTGTGKTSLARRAGLTPQEAAEEPQEVPTLTVRCHRAVVSDDATAMQVEFREAPIWELVLDAESHFANGPDGVLFVVDCTRKETVDEVLLHWLHVARYHCGPQAPFLFVGMKKDLVPQEEVTALQSRLEQLHLPTLIGSCLDPTFPSSMLKELLRLRQHPHAHRGAPLLAPLPLLVAGSGGGRSNDLEVLPALQRAALAADVTPRAPSEAPKSARESARGRQSREPWQIARGEVSISARIDAADRGAWQGGGRSPSYFGFWANIPVVAKQVVEQRSGAGSAPAEKLRPSLLYPAVANSDPDAGHIRRRCNALPGLLLHVDVIRGPSRPPAVQSYWADAMWKRRMERACHPSPMWRRLLILLVEEGDWGGATTWRADMTNGFHMTGGLRPGPGWKKRTDDRCKHTASLDALIRSPPKGGGAPAPQVFAQLVAICVISAHLPVLTAFIDNTAGQAALTKGYGMIWQRPGDEWHAGIMVNCRRVPSKAKVVDAVSRDDFARARREGWRVWTPASEIMHILAKSVDDLSTLWTKRRSTWCPVLPPAEPERSLLLKRCGAGKANPEDPEEKLRRLLRELSQVECPYLAKFYGACLDEPEQPVYLVMEYMSGGDLERFLRSKRQELHRPWTPPRSLLLSWSISAAGAVAFLAGLSPPIAHGNLRPSNLLLCTSLALRLSPSGALAPIDHRHQAEIGAPSLESCLYSAPEVLAGEPCNEVEKCIAADVFALGLVLWLMCTGIRPFQHLDNDGMHKPSDHVMEAFKEGRVPRPSLQAVKDSRFRGLLRQAWHEKPEERPHPAEILRRLREIEAVHSFSLSFRVLCMHASGLLLGFVVMIFFGHVVVAICNWTVPRVLDRSGLIGLQITLLLPNAVSVFAASCLACCWGREPVPRSPMRTLSPSPSILSFPLLDEDDPEAEIEQEIAQKSPGRVWALPCTMSASYDCCGNCGHEKLQSEKAIWLLGTWRGLLLGVLHAFQSFTNDLLVSRGRNHKEAGSVVAVNQMIALLLMPLVAFSGYFIGLRIMLVVISLLPFFGTLALLAAPSLLLEAGLLAIATAATVMPVLPLVLVPANSRSCGKSFGLLDSLYGLGQATVTVAIGALREEGGFEAALPFLAAAFASAALLSVWVAHVGQAVMERIHKPTYDSHSPMGVRLNITALACQAQHQFWKLTDEELGALLSDEIADSKDSPAWLCIMVDQGSAGDPARTEMPMGLYHASARVDELCFFSNESQNAVFKYDGITLFGTYKVEGSCVQVHWHRKSYTKIGRTTKQIQEDIDVQEEMGIEENGYAVRFRDAVYKHQRLTGWKDD
ncbi:drkC [Symbiodinium sp. KB8]|nr:drkC [Symbiodinium sp. KB8]